MSTAYAIDLVSAALVTLGDRPLAALDEATDRGRLCQALYGPTRDALLRAHPWSCARQRATLDPSAEAPAFGYPYAFNLPADCLRLLSVDPGPPAPNPDPTNTDPAAMNPNPAAGGPTVLPGTVPGGVCYAIEGRRILAMAASLQVLYVAGGDAADETQWDAAFRKALTVALAAELAYPVTQSAALKQVLEQQLQGLLKQARADNAAEKPSDVVAFESPSLAARGGVGYGAGVGAATGWWQRAWQIPSEPR